MKFLRRDLKFWKKPEYVSPKNKTWTRASNLFSRAQTRTAPSGFQRSNQSSTDASSENIKCYIIYKANSPYGDYMEWVKTGNGNLCWHQFVFDWQVVSSWTVRDVYWCWPLRQRAERLQASGWQDFHSNGKYQKGIGTLNANMLIQCWKIILAWPQRTRFLDFDLCLIHWGCLKVAIKNCCAVCLVFQSRLMLFESCEVIRSVGVYQ